jgi:RHS repeat-associated protein
VGWSRGSTQETYGYDFFGNLTNYAGRSFATSAASNRLANASYDASGNLTGFMGFSFAWDALGQQLRIQGNGLDRRFAYDASGERLVERAGSEYTFTLRRWDNRVVRQVKASLSGGSWSWSWEKDWVWGQGSLLATISPKEGLQQVVVDHQGSAALLVNRCGRRIAELATNPWGLDVGDATQNPERHRYTGHLRDINAPGRAWDDFDQMHARTYFPYTARFLSPDPGRDYDFSHPQSFNLYAYVRNNPVTATDPTGKYLVLGTNAARVRQLLVEALRRPGFRSVLCHLQADPRPFTFSVASLPNKGRISDEIAVRLGRPLTFGVTTGTLVNGVLSLERGATVTVDLQKIARFLGDETGLTTLGHELHHALAFATARDPGTALESMGLGDKLLFTNGLSLAEAFGKQLASEKPDLSKEQAEELLKNWLEDSKKLTKVTSTANPATGQEQQR